MSGIYLPYQKPPRWNIGRAAVAYNCARMGLPVSVLAMPMWEGAGNKVYDYSGQENNGTISPAGVNWQSQGLYFTGAAIDDGMVDLGTVLDITSQISMVVGTIPNTNPNPTGGGGRLISKTYGTTGDHWCLAINSDGYIDFRINNSYVLSNSAVDALKFSVLAGVYDGSNRYWYINGKEDKKLATSGAIGTGTAVGLGRNPGTTVNRDYAGFITVCYVFDVALTPTQIQTLSDNPFGMFEPIRRPAMWSIPAAGIAPTSIFYGPLVGPLGGPI